MSEDGLKAARLRILRKSDRGADIDLEVLLDVPVVMTVEVGRKSLTIKELLSLTPGAVVTFDRRN